VPFSIHLRVLTQLIRLGEKESRIKERDLPFPLGDSEEVSL
jgi:hypothetical protein